MALGLACAFLLAILALVLRFGVPRATAGTLAQARWFPLGLAAMFALLALIAAGSAGAAARLGWSGIVRLKSELGNAAPESVVLVEARIADSMKANEQGWVAWEQAGGAKVSNGPLSVTLPDGDLATVGSSYEGVYWSVQRSAEATSFYYLSRGDPVTLQASVARSGLEVQRVLGGHRAPSVQHKARMEYWSNAAVAVVAGGSTVFAPLLLVLALRRRRRELGQSTA